MNWATFYLICFVVGFALSAISLLSGMGHLHLPVKWHVHFGHSTGLGAGTQTGIMHGAAHSSLGAHAAPSGLQGVKSASLAGHAAALSPINFFTIMAFLTWFGGTGYLLTQYSSMWFALGLLVATVSGAGGAAVIFMFLTKIVLAHESHLEPEEMIGQPVAKIMPAGLEDEEQKILFQICAGRKVDHFETRRLRKDGTLIDVSVTV